ncbi:MAG: hypothetical protein AAF203_06815, partial [Pseudomonadota bacterium]
QKNCIRFGLIPLFTKKNLEVRPRRAARILRAGCVAAHTWKGEANCFQWGLLTIRGQKIQNRSRNCGFVTGSKEDKARCYRQALSFL